VSANETTGQIEVVNDRAELVRGMFEQARNGRGLHGIAKDLNGNKWAIDTLSRRVLAGFSRLHRGCDGLWMSSS
jgi:hypothetical protein